ncbi:hypothetical protein [Paludisphaera borealis]|uniref:HEPN domain-containing protein n=1 Tax=Paludisphaera borealis TaxID=1387353 RepID=A0A1U7CLZ3_9BACT|nr:hypothetical protein [Paludisphaera borealis]APW59939.1 hypothetical protein BSF38_01400 [Paludisphaera borealis]
MSLHADLLDQADQLAQLDARRPKQANLRRAVSSAYYALFHLLTSEASALYADERGLGARINRTYSHAEMKKASSEIANDKLPKSVIGSGYSTPPDLKVVANAFVTLQQARHDADYDLSLTFRRQQVLAYIALSRQAFEAWERIRKTDDARLYLACFLLWERWDKKPR